MKTVNTESFQAVERFLEQSSINNTFFQSGPGQYLVYVAAEGTASEVGLFTYAGCTDHWQAFQRAFAESLRPRGDTIHFIIVGPCADAACNCGGKVRTMRRYTYPNDAIND